MGYWSYFYLHHTLFLSILEGSSQPQLKLRSHPPHAQTPSSELRNGASAPPPSPRNLNGKITSGRQRVFILRFWLYDISERLGDTRRSKKRMWSFMSPSFLRGPEFSNPPVSSFFFFFFYFLHLEWKGSHRFFWPPSAYFQMILLLSDF